MLKNVDNQTVFMAIDFHCIKTLKTIFKVSFYVPQMKEMCTVFGVNCPFTGKDVRCKGFKC